MTRQGPLFRLPTRNTEPVDLPWAICLEPHSDNIFQCLGVLRLTVLPRATGNAKQRFDADSKKKQTMSIRQPHTWLATDLFAERETGKCCSRNLGSSVVPARPPGCQDVYHNGKPGTAAGLHPSHQLIPYRPAIWLLLLEAEPDGLERKFPRNCKSPGLLQAAPSSLQLRPSLILLLRS